MARPNHQSDPVREVERAESAKSIADQHPVPDSIDQSVHAQLADERVRSEQLNEILGLYRRLHIELEDAGRSAMIVDLFSDTRIEIQRLGFELVDLDLSSSTVLEPEVGEQAKMMLGDPSGEIRSKAARLITRLVPPDAMIVLTRSLRDEIDPVAAEPMLMGIARWPSPEAVEPVLKWFLSSDLQTFAAACNAAWALEQAGYWNPEVHHALLMAQLRNTDPKLLHEPGMKLIARFGESSDLRMLVSLLLGDSPDQQHWAANALVETPRAVEVLVQTAEENEKLFHAASESLIRHRGTPEGLRRLMSLPYPDEKTRTTAIVRMGEALDDDRLAEAVRLAGLDTTYSVLLLNRLLGADIEITGRVSKGIIQLAEIELDELRPNRAFETAITLDDVSLDPSDRAKIDAIKFSSLVLLGKMDEATELNADPNAWLDIMQSTDDREIQRRIAGFILESFGESLTEQQTTEVQNLAEPEG